MHYRKKPVLIEAFKFGEDVYPDWFSDAIYKGIVIPFVESEGIVTKASIRTLEGIMTVRLGDYVIKGVKGEIYPCKSDIFEQTYEACV